MKVIFLDFDGVLNSEGSFLYESNRRKRHKEQGVSGPVNETLCNVCTANFQAVLDKYRDAKVVISSTWRELYSLDWLKAKLESYHINTKNVIGRTPSRPDSNRGLEIKEWLDQHPEVTHYIIVDDNDWGITDVHGKDRWCETAWEIGFTFHHFQKLDWMLSNSYKEKLDAKTSSGQEGV